MIFETCTRKCSCMGPLEPNYQCLTKYVGDWKAGKSAPNFVKTFSWLLFWLLSISWCWFIGSVKHIVIFLLACCNPIWATSWQNQQNGMCAHVCPCAPSEDSGQPGHPPSLIRVFAVRMKKAWVLSYPLSGWPGWSESSLGAHSFCWFCHKAAHLENDLDLNICQVMTLDSYNTVDRCFTIYIFELIYVNFSILFIMFGTIHNYHFFFSFLVHNEDDNDKA